jgi:hypothetical protein
MCRGPGRVAILAEVLGKQIENYLKILLSLKCIAVTPPKSNNAGVQYIIAIPWLFNFISCFLF